MDNKLKEAIDICEAFGYKVIPSDLVQKLSITTGEMKKNHGYGEPNYPEEWVRKATEREAQQSLINELTQKDCIKVREWEDDFCKFKTWTLTIVN